MSLIRLILPLGVMAGLGVMTMAAAWSVGASDGSVAPIRVTASADPNKCAGCHQIDPDLSHPVGITPSMTVPSHLPLEEGRITCQTCHTEGGLEAHIEARANGDGMLREDASTLCRQCHTSTANTSRAMHSRYLGRAHLGFAARAGDQLLGSLDAESRLCLSCHDGMIASDIVGGMSTGAGAESGNHPVGIPYGNTPRGSGKFTFQSDMPVVPAETLDQRIRLFEGQVGCGSCHSPYSSHRKYVVLSNDGSRLCLSCHGGR
jgi:predicted CXXCH cytochrome family protein